MNEWTLGEWTAAVTCKCGRWWPPLRRKASYQRYSHPLVNACSCCNPFWRSLYSAISAISFYQYVHLVSRCHHRWNEKTMNRRCSAAGIRFKDHICRDRSSAGGPSRRLPCRGNRSDRCRDHRTEPADVGHSAGAWWTSSLWPMQMKGRPETAGRRPVRRSFAGGVLSTDRPWSTMQPYALTWPRAWRTAPTTRMCHQ